MHCKFDPKSNDLSLRAVPNRENYLTILKSLHENTAGGGHCGITTTFGMTSSARFGCIVPLTRLFEGDKDSERTLNGKFFAHNSIDSVDKFRALICQYSF